MGEMEGQLHFSYSQLSNFSHLSRLIWPPVRVGNAKGEQANRTGFLLGGNIQSGEINNAVLEKDT